MKGRHFNTIKGIRKLHSVVTSPRQLKVHVRQCSCNCGECLYENYPDCKNKEYVDDFREVKLEREASAAVTHSQADQTPEAQPVHLHVADLVSKDSIIAIAAEDDSYDYYLLNVTTDGVVVLTRDETDDYGSFFQAGNAVEKGNFFLRNNLIDTTFKLDIKKTTIVYPGTVRYVCSELKKKGRRRNEVYQVPVDVHEDIIASL